MARKDTRILPNRMGNVSSREPVSPGLVCSMAITCGMPLPSAPRKKRRVSQEATAAMAGVTSSGSHGRSRCSSRNVL
ncbi:hypothetical protein LMG29542_08570 [Paraburkholderia humisilvae]|uniref:Uncharacterized protein n=1 Tax=Paraburkholderia humisilvae TaxID=627669 RepID=A0A6J5F8F1_9BURK|nr:hypothetical protein LMG29542_08570 [Paraburkholderia humisilvae]